MCGCLVVAFGAMFPRVALVLLWFFSDWIQRAFSGEWVVPLLGLLFLPFTTLVYVALFAWTNAQNVGNPPLCAGGRHSCFLNDTRWVPRSNLKDPSWLEIRRT